MNKSKLIARFLNLKYRYSGNTTFWLKNENIVPIAQSALSVIDNRYKKSSLPSNVAILKCHGKRLIFQINAPQLSQKYFVVKVFLLRRLKHRLKYHWMKHNRYAFNEAANIIIAAERGIRVPQVYGYGCVYGSHHLIRASFVILGGLVDYVSVDQLLKLNRGDQKQCAKILSRTIPVFVSLYEANCNIVYILSDAIMFSSKDSKQDAFVLDFEYAKFYNKPSLEILMYEVAYFALSCPDWLEQTMVNNWLGEMLDAIEIRDESTRRKLMGRFNYYLGAICRHLSHKETVNIR